MGVKKRVPIAEARAYLSDLVDGVRRNGDRVKLTRYGKTLAYVVSKDDANLLEECKDELEECRQRKRGGDAPSAPRQK